MEDTLIVSLPGTSISDDGTHSFKLVPQLLAVLETEVAIPVVVPGVAYDIFMHEHRLLRPVDLGILAGNDINADVLPQLPIRAITRVDYLV